MAAELPILFFVFLLRFLFSLFGKFLNNKKPKNEVCPYQQTKYLDFPIFSVGCPTPVIMNILISLQVCRGRNPTNSSADLLALSGGGGGAEYGVPNRLVCPNAYIFSSNVCVVGALCS